MIDHERIEERIVAYSLGELGADERAVFEAEMREHTRGCATCTALYTDMREVAGRLALATPAESPPAGLEDRIMELATGRGVRGVEERRGPSVLGRVLLGVAASAVLIAGSVAATVAVTRPDPVSVRVVRMEAAGGGQLAVVYLGGREAVVVGDDLPALRDGRVYQLWIRTEGRMAGAGTFRPRAGDVLATTALPSEDFDLVAVTVEPSGGSEQPTSDPIASAEIPPA